MRRLFQPIATLFLILGLSGCGDDIDVRNGIPQASVTFDFCAGARNVEIDGEVFNDGRSHISEVDLEILLYDEFGNFMNSSFQTFYVDLLPGESFFFATDLRERNVFDVDVVIQNLW